MKILEHPDYDSIGPQLVYHGPVPKQPKEAYALAPSRAQHSYVYFLSIGPRPMYIGMSRNFGARFEKHKQREWWPWVDSLTLLRVEADSTWQAAKFARRIEALCIWNYRPSQNKAGLS